MQYDPSNAIVAGDDPIDWLVAVQDRVVSMHASDRSLSDGATIEDLRQSDGTLGYSPKLQHGVVGKGLNDYPSIFGLLARNQYSGWISIEDGMNGMEEMAESLAFLRRMVDRYFADQSLHANETGSNSSDRLRKSRRPARGRSDDVCRNRPWWRSVIRVQRERNSLPRATAGERFATCRK